MRSKKEVIAIAVADIHLSMKPPVCRNEEEDWFAAMKRPLDELRKLGGRYHVPIICAGDIFHHWKSPPELINFALKNLPKMHAVPGQHDLPLHRYEDIRKSAYWTLIIGGTINNLEPTMPFDRYGLFLHGFPWRFPISSECTGYSQPTIAVIHKYIWKKKRILQIDTDETNVKTYRKELKGFDFAIFGDNHIGFIDGSIINCGSLMRRTSDQMDYRPQVGLLYSDNTIEPHYLDIEGEKIHKVSKEEKRFELGNIQKFLEGIKGLETDEMDFRKIVNHYLEKEEVEEDVCDIILGAIDNE